MTPDRIGFDRFIRLRWLDETALLAAGHRDGDVLRKALLQRLAHDLAGKEAQQKTVIQLTRIWWRVPMKLVITSKMSIMAAITRHKSSLISPVLETEMPARNAMPAWLRCAAWK